MKKQGVHIVISNGINQKQALAFLMLKPQGCNDRLCHVGVWQADLPWGSSTYLLILIFGGSGSACFRHSATKKAYPPGRDCAYATYYFDPASGGGFLFYL